MNLINARDFLENIKLISRKYVQRSFSYFCRRRTQSNYTLRASLSQMQRRGGEKNPQLWRLDLLSRNESRERLWYLKKSRANGWELCFVFNLHIILYANAFWLVECANGRNACKANARFFFRWCVETIDGRISDTVCGTYRIYGCVCVRCVYFAYCFEAREFFFLFSESPSSRNAVFSYIKKNFFMQIFFSLRVVDPLRVCFVILII